jgi:transcription factor E2F7/8
VLGAKVKKPEKTLLQISSSILRMYFAQHNVEICLKNLALELQIERRRVYDIVNIFEAFDILAKKSKNIYIWKGVDDFKRKLDMLECIDASHTNQHLIFSFEFKPVKSKKKMLTYTSIKVLRFLGLQSKLVSFNQIVDLCLETHAGNASVYDRKCSTTRRLYDIINVLRALGLISKVHSKQQKKFYRWNGKEGIEMQFLSLQTQRDSQTQFFDLCQRISPLGINKALSSLTGTFIHLPASRTHHEGFKPCKAIKR